MDLFEQCKKLDCLAFATQHLNLSPAGRDGRFHRPWSPGSDSGALAISADGWFDHVEKIGGDLPGLVARVVFGNDDFMTLVQAAKWVADRAGIEYQEESDRGTVKAKTSAPLRVIASYIYEDVDGERLIRVQKTDSEPRFYQERWTGSAWKKGVKGVKRVPYRCADWAHCDTVFLCEGEKDADSVRAIGLPATTFLNGAGAWEDEYAIYFNGKTVTILPDQDDPGRAGAERIAALMRDAGIAVRILHVGQEGEDVTDWIEYVQAFEEFDPAEHLVAQSEGAPDAGVISPVELAKIANREPFRNFDLVEDHKGREAPQPRGLRSLVCEVHRRLLGFPAISGDILFDYDRDGHRIHRMYNHSALFAWMGMKTGQTIDWSATRGMVAKAELFEALKMEATRYAATSPSPHYPPRKDVFYFHDELPPPTHDRRYFHQFCSMFSPASEVDRLLIQTFVASCLYWRKGVQRPMWVIDSDSGQGVGKTTLVNMVASLIGGYSDENQAPITIQPSELRGDVGEVKKQLVTQEAACRRVLLIDNVVHDLNCDHLASMSTAATIQGRPPYSKEVLSRLNDLTFVITTNAGTVSRDIASRSYHIKLTRPADNSGWGDRVRNFLETKRFQILADCIAILETPAPFNGRDQSRHRAWEQEVLMPIVGTMDAYSDVIKATLDRQSKADNDEDEAQDWRDRIVEKLAAMDPRYPDIFCFITNAALVAIIGDGKRNTVLRKLRNAALTGIIPELDHDWSSGRYPCPGGRRGMAWNRESASAPDQRPVVIKSTTSGRLEAEIPGLNF